MSDNTKPARGERYQECPEAPQRIQRIENAVNLARQLGFFDGVAAAEEILGSVSGVVGARAKLNRATADYEAQFPAKVP